MVLIILSLKKSFLKRQFEPLLRLSLKLHETNRIARICSAFKANAARLYGVVSIQPQMRRIPSNISHQIRSSALPLLQTNTHSVTEPRQSSNMISPRKYLCRASDASPCHRRPFPCSNYTNLCLHVSSVHNAFLIPVTSEASSNGS